MQLSLVKMTLSKECEKHRLLTYPYLRQQYGELRKDLPVYLYDEGMTLSTQAAVFLGKHGYNHLYILKDGYRAWDGKTKKSKY